jgi:ligand-binding SRPBCC domain-containing protein
MVRIDLLTEISAPIGRVFDLARSTDLHMASTNWTGERAIDGVTSGLIGPGQQVTWRGRHFGFMVHHTSEITAYQFPTYFQDSMVRGLFKSFCHDHHFEAVGEKTRMRDEMEFVAPFGVLGIVAERLALERHLRDLLHRRNETIRRVAESDEWKSYLPS